MRSRIPLHIAPGVAGRAPMELDGDIVMQMYEVTFQVHYEEVIDLGKILVCANDKDAAVQIVRFFLGVPASQAVFNATRIKPSVYQLDRREIVKNRDARKRRDNVHSMRDLVEAISEVQNTPPPLESSPYVLGVTAGVRAMSETAAWVKLGHAIIDRAHHNSSQLNQSITEFEMVAEQARFRPKPSALEKQAIYKEPRFFAGGAARPR